MSGERSGVLAIGLDATSPDLVRRWMADGTMPNLGAIASRGRFGSVRGVDGFYVGSSWPTMYTGLDPSGHGVHYELQLRPGTYEMGRVQHGSFVHGTPLWTKLDRAGRRVAALDVPLARLDEGLGGVQVVDWGGHDAFFGFGTQPPEFAASLVERFGRSPHEEHCDVRRSGATEYASLVELLEASADRRADWTVDLLGREVWDLFFVVFTEAHCAGHQCWHLHDPSHPAHDDETASVVGDPLRRVYRRLDQAVGRLVDRAPDMDVVVFSCHGMSHWSGAHFLFRPVLEGLGVTAWQPQPEAAPGPLERAARGVWRRLPDPARSAIRSLRSAGAESRARTDAPIPPLGIDPTRSLCFPVRNGTSVEGIRLNVSGREPDGRLSPGDEVDEFCRRLRDDLLAILDERTGRPAFQRVERTSDLYTGDRLGALPDLLAWWDQDIATGSLSVGNGVAAEVRLSSPRLGTVEGANSFVRTGGHRRDGWFVSSGGDWLSDGPDVDLVDLSPRIAARLGVGMPHSIPRP